MKQVRQQDARARGAGVQHPSPLFSGNISVADYRPLSTQKY